VKRWGEVFLAFRSILFVFLIPGTVAGYIPVLIVRSSDMRPSGSIGTALAACLIVLGASVLLRCVWDFFAAGRGTLAPFDAPRRLVVKGLYRFTRNPMYNGVISALIGEAWLFRSLSLWEYAALVFVMFHLFVIVYEEPTLELQFGESFRAYKRAVPRWGFTMRPFTDARFHQ
jgi:protein-S-isoprenylcysteine O-methyltransferase Ste14